MFFKKLFSPKISDTNLPHSAANTTSISPKVGANPIQQFGDWDYAELTTSEDIFHCFRLILGRAPNREEWPGHSLQIGKPLDLVLASYINSLEFAQRQEKLVVKREVKQVQKIRINDVDMIVSPDDLDVGAHLVNGEYEPHVTKVFRQQITHRKMNIIDLGANIGYFTMLAASMIDPDGQIFAVEPSADNVKLIELSRRQNEFNNIQIINTAVGETIGILGLNGSYSNGTTASLSNNEQSLLDSTVVPCLPLDNLIPAETRIDLIKIDVEGYEYRALLGAQRLLSTWHPIIISEFSPDFMPLTGKNDGRTYLRFLFELGYHAAIIERDGNLLETGQDVEKLMEYYEKLGEDHVDLLFRYPA